MSGIKKTNIGIAAASDNFSTNDEADGQFRNFRKSQIGWGDRIGDSGKVSRDYVTKAYKTQMAFNDAADYFKKAGPADQYDLNHMEYGLLGRKSPRNSPEGEDTTREDAEAMKPVDVSDILDAFNKINKGKYTICSTASATADSYDEPLDRSSYDGQIQM